MHSRNSVSHGAHIAGTQIGAIGPCPEPLRLTDSQSMILFSSPRCRDELCTQLAHYFVRRHGSAVELGMLSFTS
jgi:hypothetical protein